MSAALYLLTILTTLVCSVLLLRAWFRVRNGLLLWSGLCFAGLTIDNVLVLGDMVLFPATDLYTWRLASTAISISLLLFGLIWERQ
ncbi:MAG TPA: DUF5985 family protein [Acidobacteriaceae bacterium]|nr:DUF5985 family protein [Acidobacteriaceae bacterium]